MRNVIKKQKFAAQLPSMGSAYTLILSLAVFFLIQGSAFSQLIESGDSVLGKNSITFDPATGLEWLDVTLSTGRSFVDVAGETGVGGDFEGFRHATEAELLELLVHARESRTVSDMSDVSDVWVYGLLDLVGITWSSCLYDCYAGTSGFLSDSINKGERVIGEISCIVGHGAPKCWTSTSNSLDELASSAGMGHWLIRLHRSAIGDVNQDGIVNLLDVSPFADVISEGKYQNEADINWDGTVDLLDVEPFVNLLGN